MQRKLLLVEDEGLDRRRRRGGVCTKIYVEISGKTNRVIRSVYRDNISEPQILILWTVGRGVTCIVVALLCC